LRSVEESKQPSETFEVCCIIEADFSGLRTRDVFESIDELINSDTATTRKRFAIGGVSSVIVHIIVYSFLLTSAVLIPGYYQHGYRETASGGDLVVITHVARLQLPPTPRITPATQNQPRGNADIE